MSIARNNASIEFDEATGTFSAKPQWVGINTAASGSGNFVGKGEITTAENAYATPTAGRTVVFEANALEIEIPDGDLTQYGSDLAVDGVIISVLYLMLHSAEPNTNGSNELTSAGGYSRAQIPISLWTVTAT